MKQLYLISFGLLIGLLASGLILIIASPDSGQPIILYPAPTATETSTPKPTKTNAPITVQINGEIQKPGIYAVPENSRVEDLILAAGGLTEDADIRFVNFALIVRDGDYIYIPSEGEKIPEIARNSSINALLDDENDIHYPININEASQDDFESLPGIGPSKASDIIAYRQMVGSFSSLDDLLEISGIGPATLEALSDYLICYP